MDRRGYGMGLTGCEWAETHKTTIMRTLGITDLQHTHHVGEDAAKLATVFDAVLANGRAIRELG